MKRVILIGSFVLLICQVQAQSRKQVAAFSQFKHYFNPSLTGMEGTVIRSLYRNQWTGFEDAPKTVLASAEFALGNQDHRAYSFNGSSRKEGAVDLSAKHALGFTAFHDQFGPTKETQFALSYGAGVSLSEQLSLRWGVALTYSFHRLDGNSLTLDQENDPRYRSVLGQNNRSGRGDINLGLSLVAANYYVGYALQDITEGKVIAAGDRFLNDLYARKHFIQAGYRASLTEQWGFTMNGIYQYDERLKSTVEGQVKMVYQNTIWVGGGYRYDLAYNLTAGVRLDQLRIGYAYESPVQRAQAINKSTNEITVSYSLKALKKHRNQLTIW